LIISRTTGLTLIFRGGHAATRLLVLALFVSAVFGCAGGMPKVPDSPEGILTRAESYYQKSKWFQAQELYKAFLSRYPGHDRSDYAQFMLAESYYNNGEYPLAGVEYQILMNNYGYSEYVDDALFKLGLCNYHEAPKFQRDQQKSRDALSKFNQFVQTFPNSPLIPEVENYIKLIQEKLAKKTFETGHFYFRRKKWTAALIYFDKVVEDYPNNEYWARSAYFRGLILEDRGDVDGAVRSFSLVLTYPEDVSYKSDARSHLNDLRR
jgi:outer membrane protein assembly factor BamD